MLLDKYLPVYDFNEVHVVIIRTAPEKAFAAIKELKSAELSPLAYWLMSIRELPARLMRKLSPQIQGDRPFLEELFEGGFIGLDEAPIRKSSLGWSASFGS